MNLTSKQLRHLILYHSANSRFHNVQASLIKNAFFPEKGFNSEPTNEFEKLCLHHHRMSKRHRESAEKLQHRLELMAK
jgi:hypothetical protein